MAAQELQSCPSKLPTHWPSLVACHHLGETSGASHGVKNSSNLKPSRGKGGQKDPGCYPPGMGSRPTLWETLCFGIWKCLASKQAGFQDAYLLAFTKVTQSNGFNPHFLCFPEKTRVYCSSLIMCKAVISSSSDSFLRTNYITIHIVNLAITGIL